MLYIILISLITLALLALLVLGLHRYQLSIAQTNADKHSPLPPLDNISMDRDLPDLTLSDDTDLAAGETTKFDIPSSTEPDDKGTGFHAYSASLARQLDDSESQSNTALQVQSDSAMEIDVIPDDVDGTEEDAEEDTEILVPDQSAQQDEVTDVAFVETVKKKHSPDVDHNCQAVSTEIPPELEAAPAKPEAGPEPEPAGSWQENVAELKKLDRLDEALEVCRQEYPLWSAYQQASLIHRAKIKQLAQGERDVAAELAALYRLAAEASFLHDRVKGLPNLSLAQLKLLDLSPIADLDMPYERIGYTELRLIKKTDIKLLLDNWGKPESHRRPREIHADAWQNLCGDTQSTLF